jgi:hypothetical protein
VPGSPPHGYLTEGSDMGFFEENPVVFVTAVIVTVEVWLRIRARILGLLRLPQGKPPV